MRTFSPDEMNEAFAHLGADRATIRKVWEVLPTLAAEIGGSRTVDAVLASGRR